jgi:tetratricopeptide (TPR) repeat protein
MLESAAEGLKRALGVDHLETLDTLHQLAVAYLHAGKLPEASALFEQVRDGEVKKLGADDPLTLITLSNLASTYQYAGRLPEAIALLEQARDTITKKLGPDHPFTLTTIQNLARAYQDGARLPEAVPLFEQAATGVAKRQFQHQNAGVIITNTIAAYEQAGQLDKAEGWRRQWLAVVKQQAGADSSAYAGELAALGLNLLQQKKLADAEPILRECLALREKKEPDDWRMFNTQSQLGGALLGQKKYAEAEPLLLKGYGGMKAREKTIPPQASTCIPEAVGRLIDLYAATYKAEEVKKWQAERAKYPNAKPAKPVN